MPCGGVWLKKEEEEMIIDHFLTIENNCRENYAKKT